MSQPTVSILVCTWNGEQRLEECLYALARQDCCPSQYEVILVDNMSTDRTNQLAHKLFLDFHQISYRVLIERRQGLHFARRLGTLAAAGKIIIFCDDDNVLAADYVKKAINLFDNNPTLGVVGSTSYPLLPNNVDLRCPMFWSNLRSYAVGALYPNSSQVNPLRTVWGAGMVVRTEPLRNLYLEYQDFCLTGRRGSHLTAGDDSEICLMFSALGFEVAYTHELQFGHRIPLSRISAEYVARMHNGFAHANAVINAYRMMIVFIDLLTLSLSRVVSYSRSELISIFDTPNSVFLLMRSVDVLYFLKYRISFNKKHCRGFFFWRRFLSR